MPTYKVTDPNSGRTLRLTGDSPPTEQELEGIFSSYSSKPKPMFSSSEEAAIGQEKAQKELRIAQMQNTPLAVLAKGMRMASSPLENSVAAGIPDIVSKKLTGEPYVEPDAQMKFLSEPLGMVAGASGSAGVAAGKALLPVIKGGLRVSEKGIPTVLKDTVGRKIGRGAITGGVAGGTQLSSDEEGNVNLGNQAVQGTMGAVAGSLIVPAGAFVSKAGNAYRKWKSGAKTPRADILTGKINQQKQDITLTAAQRSSEQRSLKDKFDTDLEESKKVLQGNFDNLSREFQESAETGAMNMQDSVKFVSNEMGESYGIQLENIGDDLIKSGQPITNSELSSVFSQTRANLQDNLITSGHVVDMINKMESKYGQKFIGGQGFRASIKPRSNVDDVVDFRSLVKDIKDIKKGIKFGGKTEDNVALGIFYDDLTSYLGQRPGLEKYLKLNQTYAPYIQSLKTLTKQTKAYAGESETQQATNLLKRFGLRKANVVPGKSLGGSSPAEASVVRNIETLQQPSPFSKGMGTQATDPVVLKAQQLSEAKQATEEISGIIDNQRKVASSNLDKKFLGELDNIMGSKKYVESDYTLKEAMIKDALNSKLKRIGYRQNQIDVILKDRQKLRKVAGLLVKGAVGTATVLTLGNAIGRAVKGH
jgi:hypothetical protein